MLRNLKTLIVITAYNCQATLLSLVQAAVATGFDLLVVDDGSTDLSLQTIAAMKCRTLILQEHRGKGAALLAGAEQAAKLGYDTIVALDGDGQYNPEDIHLLVTKAQHSITPCVVISARQQNQNAALTAKQWPKTPENFWVRLECGLEISDVESSFRLYPIRELLAQNIARDNYGFEIETIVKLAWSGIPVSSVPVTTKKPSNCTTLPNSLRLASLHSQLLLRRLLPWPHKKLTQEEPFPKKAYATISRNPLKVLREICREHTSPLWLAMAVWLGIFMGALPLLAVHTLAIIYVAHRFHMNKVAAVAASQFCMPPVVPVLCIQMGYYLRNGKLLVDFSWQPWLLGIHERLWEWLIGSLLVGPFLGLIGALIMYVTASRLQNYKLQRLD
ncbi:MAG: DUF2062 domain-containing protein [Pseudomonadota bacterium]